MTEKNNEQVVDIREEEQEVKFGRPRVPLQRTRIGKAGYVGDVEVYDPLAPNVPLVSNEPDGNDEKPKRRRTAPNKARKAAEDK